MVLICVKLNYGAFENYPLTMELSEPVEIKDIIEYVERTIRSSDKTIKEGDKLVSNLIYKNLGGLPNVELKALTIDKIIEANSIQNTRILVVTENIREKGQLKKKKSKKRKKSKGRGKGKGSKGKGSKGKGSKGKGSKGKGSKGKGSKSSSSRRKRKYKTIKRK